MKVVRVDNFARETVDDKLIADGLSSNDAEAMAEKLNKEQSGPDSPVYYRVVADDYKLREWEP